MPDAPVAHRLAPRLRRALTVLASAVVPAACGGGLYLGVDLSDSDQPPSVALTAAVTEAQANTTVRLVAAATDDFGVDSVAFYRAQDNGPATLLATDGFAPYQLDTVIPASPAGTVWRYFARAFDGLGQHADSAPLDITVR